MQKTDVFCFTGYVQNANSPKWLFKANRAIFNST